MINLLSGIDPGPLLPVRACGNQIPAGDRPAVARTPVTDGSTTVKLDDELIEAVMGRLDETSGFGAEPGALLSVMP
jgi:hypothetical protein